MGNLNNYPVTPAVAFPNKPKWPVYEAPTGWYIQRGERFGK
jgi:hypothetical protein